MPRICMLSYYFHPHYSGSAVQAQNLCRHLKMLGIESFIVSANLTDSPSSEELDGIQVYRLPVIDIKNLRVPSFWISTAAFLFKNRHTFDLIHAHGTYQHGIAGILSTILRKPSVLKIAMAQSDIAFRRQGRVLGRMNRRVVRMFSAVVATSEAVMRECATENLPTALIPNGVDTDRFRPARAPEEKRDLRRRLGLPDAPTVIFVGVLNPRKNIDAILRVWRRLRKRNIQSQLLLVGPFQTTQGGRTSDYCVQLQEFVRAEGLQQSVTFAGAQEDVASYLRCGDVFYFPSRQEGMPNALLEAMASGLAAVVSNISGTADLVNDGTTGYLTDLAAEDQQADTIEALLTNSTTRLAVGAAARAFVVENFSLSRTAARYSQLYCKLLENGNIDHLH